MQLTQYLARIGYVGSTDATLETLFDLHQRHMLAIPFENLDVILKRPIQLDTQALVDKLVLGGRGGFCYEQNTLFGHMLKQLGYDVSYISARVWNGQQFGLDREHIALLVRVGEHTLLADVGFGDAFLQPLYLDAHQEQWRVHKAYRVIPDGDNWVMQEKNSEVWDHGFWFCPQPLATSDFETMCHWTQTSPNSNFTKRMICTIARPNGRVTLRNNRWIETVDGVKNEYPLPTLPEFRAFLEANFAMHFTDAELQRLMQAG